MKRRFQKERSRGGEAAVQLRSAGQRTFGELERYVPLLDGDTEVYRLVREAVPVVDAAIGKIIRLSNGGKVYCEDRNAERELGQFLR